VNHNDAALALFWRCDAVVFDLDGTLVQTLEGLHQALNDALGAHGFAPVSANLVRASMHGGFLGSVLAALEGCTVVERHQVLVLETYRARYRELMLSRSLVYAQVLEVLQAQQARGCRLAVCSNRDESLAIELLQGVGLRGAFDAIVGLREGSEPKPKPDLLLRSLRELGVVASRSLMVGDSAADVGCAAAVGVPCLVFEGGYGADSLGPSVTGTRFSSYQELLLARPQSA
jgi:phosphoglycolate phosphatase